MWTIRFGERERIWNGVAEMGERVSSQYPDTFIRLFSHIPWYLYSRIVALFSHIPCYLYSRIRSPSFDTLRHFPPPLPTFICIFPETFSRIRSGGFFLRPHGESQCKLEPFLREAHPVERWRRGWRVEAEWLSLPLPVESRSWRETSLRFILLERMT